MKLLIIICSHEFNIENKDNIKILNEYFKKNADLDIDYCGISNQDDFHNYETILEFKYKIINTRRQFCKISDFITDYKSELSYDWYMKIRPDVRLLEHINFDTLSENAVNARARVYYGPKKIKYGLSVNGDGFWKHPEAGSYAEKENNVILDDMLFIFHKNIIKIGAFDKIENETSFKPEWQQGRIFNDRKIPLNVIGINFKNTKYNSISGHINMQDYRIFI